MSTSNILESQYGYIYIHTDATQRKTTTPIIGTWKAPNFPTVAGCQKSCIFLGRARMQGAWCLVGCTAWVTSLLVLRLVSFWDQEKTSDFVLDPFVLAKTVGRYSSRKLTQLTLDKGWLLENSLSSTPGRHPFQYFNDSFLWKLPEASKIFSRWLPTKFCVGTLW